MNWVDGFILVVLITSTVKGYSQGFVTSLMNVAGFVVSIVVARLYFKDLANYLTDNTALYRGIYLALSKGLERRAPLLRDGGSVGLGLPGLPQNLIPYSMPAGGDLVTAGVARTMSGIIISLVSIILIFLAVRLCFIMGIALLNSVAGLPVLRQFNKLGGIMIGFLKGTLGLMLAFVLVIPLMAVFPMQWLLKGIQSSAIASYFYGNNLIVPWATEILSKMM